MTRIETTIVTDDFDGSAGATTVRFGLDGDVFEVDLSPENEAELRQLLTQYIDVGRKLSRSGQAYARVESAPDGRAVRAWAEASGIPVSPRGRISRDVIAQFRAAGH